PNEHRHSECSPPQRRGIAPVGFHRARLSLNSANIFRSFIMRNRWCVSLFVCASLLIGLTSYAQSTTSLRGVITDPTGAVIPGAVVTLSNAGTGFKRQALTSEDGVYQFLQAPPGTYQVAIEKTGFTSATRDGVQLQVNTPATLDLRMEVGGTSDVVNVQADATVINTVDASIGNPFSEQQVRQLPLGTRNVVELLSLQVGVTPT